MVGKQVAKLAEGTSRVPAEKILALFKDPKKILTALSLKKSGAEMGAAKRALGVTPEEEFLIAKAGDRTPGTSRSVADKIREKMGSDFLSQEVLPKTIKPTDNPIALYIGRQDYGEGKAADMFNIYGNHPQAKSTVTKETLEAMGIPVIGVEAGRTTSRQAPVGLKNLSTGELLALNRASGQAAKELKGSEKVLYARLKAAAEREIQTRSPQMAQSIKDYAYGKTRQAFSSAFPVNKQGKIDYFRLAGGAAAGAFNPLMALGASPAAIGVGTLAARGGYEVAKKVAPAVGAVAGAAASRLGRPTDQTDPQGRLRAFLKRQ